jgi:hypothetical protein
VSIPSITLWINEDIEFVQVKDFDPPTPQDLSREVQTAKIMDRWVEEYNIRMEAKRTAWLNEPHYDHEGWPAYG